jgi:RNA polymerase sigma-70 factor (ECF subfamily)
MPFSNSQDLLTRFNQREPAAFNTVYKEYYSYVYTIVRKMTSGSADTPDLVADCFDKLVRYKGSFAGLENIRKFLYTITKHICLDYLKHRRVHKSRTLDIESYFDVYEENDFERAERSAIIHSMIEKTIEKLPRQCRLIFLLFYVEELRNKEIAKRLGIAVKTVVNQKVIALQALKMSAAKINRYSLTLFILIQHYFFPIDHVLQFI